MGYFFLELEGWLTFFNLKDGLLSVPSSENMAPCRDDASVSLLPNMRVIPLCQGDGRMIHLVQRVCNNVQSIWYNYNVSVMIYLVQYIWHNVPVTCNFCRPNMRVMPLCQGECRMIHLVQRICNKVPGTKYYNGMIYLCTIHLAQCTCYMQFLAAQYARHATVPGWRYMQSQEGLSYNSHNLQNPTTKYIRDGYQHDQWMDVLLQKRK